MKRLQKELKHKRKQMNFEDVMNHIKFEQKNKKDKKLKRPRSLLSRQI